MFALAILHHLAIANNVPLRNVAGFLSQACHSLIIEFVPKRDSQVQRLLSNREDIFDGYNQQGFERDFGERFTIQRKRRIADSDRTLYLMKRR